MMITDEYVTALRAFLTGNPAFDELSRHLEERDGSEGGTAYATLLGMALLIAARQRFARGYTYADVIRFVAQARSASPHNLDRVDPRAAELMLRAILGETSAAQDLSDKTKALTTTVLLSAMIDQERPSGPELDTLLAEARKLAGQALAGLR